jgi:hypothetical protein
MESVRCLASVFHVEQMRESGQSSLGHRDIDEEGLLPAVLIFGKYKQLFQDVRLPEALSGPGGRRRSCRY